jgi:hypothetical protein
LPRIEENRGSWVRRPKFYKRVVEPHKKKKKYFSKTCQENSSVFKTGEY